MKEYTSNQRKKIVLKINKVKNKEILASKYNISIRTYYYWKRQLETCSIINPKSTKPKTNKNKLKDKKIIKRIVEIRKKKKKPFTTFLKKQKSMNRYYALRTSSICFL